MRNQWLRLLLLRCNTPYPPYIYRHSQLKSFRPLNSSPLQHPPFANLSPFNVCRYFSSSPELAVEPPKPPADETFVLAEIFAKPGKSAVEIKQELDSNNVIFTHDLILSVLRSDHTTPDVARRLFDWVLESNSEKLSSKSYNLMLGILGSNGFVQESWDMIGQMKKKGYGVSKGTLVRISDKFKADGLNDDVEKLKDLYASGSASIKINDSRNESTAHKSCSWVSQIIRREVWDDNVEKRLQESDVEFSSEMVTMVLENRELELNKVFIFFRWAEESGLFKHDQSTYNAMTRVLCREEYIEKFWKVVNEMRGAGYEMERETYFMVSERFVTWKMMKDAVNLYEFAMTGGNKPSVQDCIFLLKKIVVSKELDMDLFFKVVRVFNKSGNVFTDANLNSMLKSLTSVGRFGEWNEILEAMEKGGYLPSVSSQCQIAFKLGSGGKSREAREFMDKMVGAKGDMDNSIWVSLLKGYCLSRDLDEATHTLSKMVEQKGASSSAEHALQLLVGTYCRKNKPLSAYKLVLEMVNGKGLTPRHTTYKELTSKLLHRKHFKEALDVMCLMKNHGYPPVLDSFIVYLSRIGNVEEAVRFSQALSSKRSPSESVYLRLFEAYLKAGRHNEAQDFLAKCPSHIRNHSDVLNLFCIMKSRNKARNVAGVVL
ncbi:pentatricopeptide repeat-containing protein mitochondrial-like [Dorcoceras hygrometricum]|uniref:Pentatricopeptide repeat-containing protein mitochondrial-like n=1 Tax=Dorcoceras hygrometricum TaxID=472368 RepID=A0A2Z7CLU9_9LAMI|nr:pentatricopeptide repeat-containing protein mitochondrial-like [Dorcoceras hygrometricum]